MSAAALDATFSALADPTRRRVVERLRERPHRAGELAEALRTSPPAMSRHLRVLRDRGLVELSRPAEDGRGRVYRLRPDPFRALHGWVEEVETFWAAQLDAFVAHAERGRGGRRRSGP